MAAHHAGTDKTYTSPMPNTTEPRGLVSELRQYTLHPGQLRGFTGMAAQADAIAAFYGGPVWLAHRNAANTTMLDSDDAWRRGPPPAGQKASHDRLGTAVGAAVVAPPQVLRLAPTPRSRF